MFRVAKISKETWWLVVILAIALILRLSLPAPILSPDSALYLELADRIQAGHLSIDRFGETFRFIQPGYSMCIAAVNFIVLNAVTSGLAVSMISGLGTILLAYFLGKRMFNQRVGYIFALCIALHPFFIVLSGRVLTESVFAFVLLGIIYLFWRNLTWRRSFIFIIVGFMIGFLYLIRLIGLTVCVYPIILFIIFYIRKIITFRQATVWTAGIIFGVLVVSVPYISYLSHQANHLTFTGLQDSYITSFDNETDIQNDYFTQGAENSKKVKYSIFNSLNDSLTDYQINSPLSLQAAGNQTNALSLARLALSNAIMHFSYNIKLFFFIFFFEIVAAIYVFWKLRKSISTLKVVLYLLGWIPFVMAIMFIGRPIYRYYFPVMPILLIIAAVAIDEFFKSFRRKFIANYFMLLSILFLLLYGLILNGMYFHDYSLRFGQLFIPDGSQQFGILFQQQFGSELRVLSNDKVFCFFAKAQCLTIPYAPFPDLLTFAIYQHMQYFIVSDNILTYHDVGLDVLQTNFDEKVLTLRGVYGRNIIYEFVQ